MPPVAEPQAGDVAAVQAMLDGAPQAPAPAAPEPVQPQAPAQPAPVAPAAPTNQPLDPFAMLAQPAAPAEPAAPQPTQPTEPVTTPQPATPAEPAPVAPAQPEVVKYQTFDEYMESIAPTPATPVATPDASQIDPTDQEGIKKFFDDLVNTAVEKATQTIGRKEAIQTAERQLWDRAFEKYGSLRENKKARDLVHSIRMGHFQRGQAITPTQAADILLESMGQQYQKGVADSAVVTTIEEVQPQGGGTGAAVPTSQDINNDLIAVQAGGEVALADILDRKIKAGQL